MEHSTKTVAEGCFGKVYKEKFNGTWAAMKKVPRGFISKQQLDRECRIYYNTHHSHVVKLLGDPWLQDGRWHIPLEFIFGEDLETTMFKVQRSKIQLNPKVKATIILGMCEGLFHLHSKDIVHQDLKPDNIMVEHGTHRAVIIDMGLAKFSVNGLSSGQNMGNEAYAAPEILHANRERDKRSDVWAMGKIIAELITGVRLRTGFVSSYKIREILRDSPFCNIVSKMVDTNPSERATMAELIFAIRRLCVNVLLGIDMVGKPEAGRANPGFVAQERHTRGVGPVDRAPNPIRDRMPTPFPEAVVKRPAVRANRSPSPQPIAGAVTELFKMPMRCPPNGAMTHRIYDVKNGQLRFTEIVMENDAIVKYDDMKIRLRRS